MGLRTPSAPSTIRAPSGDKKGITLYGDRPARSMSFPVTVEIPAIRMGFD
jgi:hypothetical protein